MALVLETIYTDGAAYWTYEGGKINRVSAAFANREVKRNRARIIVIGP